MTKTIYFFLMGVFMFVLPQLFVKVFNRVPKIDKNITYLLFALLLPMFWVLLPEEISSMREVNFIQHFVGGGVSVGFVAIYIINSLKSNFPLLKKFLVQILVLYALVSMLGVANELAEFSLDYFHLGIFSIDRYDTWYDLVANTTGALCVFLIYKVLIGFSTDK